MSRETYAKRSLGEVYDKVHKVGKLSSSMFWQQIFQKYADCEYFEKAKVLMVGAGGIGCELLKNLVLTGFGEVHLVSITICHYLFIK